MRREIEELARLVLTLTEDLCGDAGPKMPAMRIRLQEVRQSLSELAACEAEWSRKTTELIAARSALETDRQYYRRLFGYAPDGQAITNRDGIIVEANRACAQLLQVHPDYLPHKSILWFLAEQDRPVMESRLRGLLADSDRPPRTNLCTLLPRYEEPILGIVTLVPVLLDTDVRVHWLLREAGLWL